MASANGFDLAELQALFKNDTRKNLVFLARMAEAAERYEDMCKLMRALVEYCSKQSDVLTVEERNLLSVAFKNVIGTRRASWRTINAETENNDENEALLQEYKRQLEKELKDTCSDILSLLDAHLIPSVAQGEGEPQVFYLKMAGDYYRYQAESAPNEKHELSAAEYYKKAYVIAEAELKPTHPIRLGLALNYSVCYYEILKDQKKARDMAKNAFDNAISKLDKIDEVDYKDSTLIMQLLKDNLTLWASNESDQNNDDDVTISDVVDEGEIS